MTIVLNGTAGITAPGTETFGDGTALGGATNPIVSMAKGANNYVQGYIVNNTDGVNASADLVCYPSNGTDSSGWIDMGITGPTFSQAAYGITGANEGYIFMSAPSGASKTGNLVIATDSTGTQNAIKFATGGFGSTTERMRLDSSGNLGIGTASPATKLDVSSGSAITSTFRGFYSFGASNCNIRLINDGTTYGYISQNPGAGGIVVADGMRYYGGGPWTPDGTTASSIQQLGGAIIFTGNTGLTGGTNFTPTERMRIDSSGRVLAGVTTPVNSAHTFSVSQANSSFIIQNTGSSGPYGLQVRYSAVDPNNVGSSYLEIYNAFSSTLRAEIRSNGGLANYQGNNVNLSDRREKTNFAPAGEYLSKICAIPVQTFNYIDQNLEEDDGLTLGVIAQDVQAVAPELVMESNWASKDSEPKMRLSIYQTDLQYALMKCIQEQQAIIESLKARLDAANL